MKHLISLSAIVLLVWSAALGQSPAVQPVGSPVALISGENYYMSPKWSPDGSMLAVTTSNYKGIDVVTYPDGNIIPLSEDRAAGFGMQWSHDGQRIVARIANFENKRRTNALATFNVLTGKKTLLTDFVTRMPGVPEWTADDQYVYLNGTDRFRLFPSNPNVSLKTLPQTEIMYVKQNQIKRREVAAKSESTIQVTTGEPMNLTVSPDGQKIAFEIYGGHMWVANVDGTHPVDLGVGFQPYWAPSSDKLTYMITTDDGQQFTSADVYVINIDGTGKVDLTNTDDVFEMHPSWSPDSKHIAFDTYNTGRILIQEIQ